jgi:protoporphyrinogen oxidase
MAKPAYDCIIVGGGISGLHAALELQKNHPSWSIAILEKYDGLGGRTFTYHTHGTHWEAGAGRICQCHYKTKGLVHKYGLNLIQIQKGEDIFSDVNIPFFIEPLQLLPQDILEVHTLFELLEDIYGSKAKTIVESFPYWAEIYSLRADLALKSFSHGEMSNNHPFFVIKEGFGKLIKNMRAEFEEKGGEVLVKMVVEGVEKGEGSSTDLQVAFDKNKIKLRANKVCLMALDVDSVRKIRGLSDLPVLKKLKTSPLLRIYAIFPKPWSLGRVITSERIRYIIPIQPEKGVVMISYTDGDDTKPYAKLVGSDSALEKAVMADIRSLFPDEAISDPIFIKAHYWQSGCTYWQPGHYDPYKESEAACQPLIASLPNLFMCGESFSTRQAWVEGALDHTDKCLAKIG